MQGTLRLCEGGAVEGRGLGSTRRGVWSMRGGGSRHESFVAGGFRVVAMGCGRDGSHRPGERDDVI